MNKVTRLDKLFRRLQAQHLCLEWVFNEIAGRPGVVFEMGLGHGRTYDHLRTYLPGREIYVFDREIDCFEDCTPPDDRLLLGDIADTLAAAVARFGGQVVLANADLGSYDETHNVAIMAKLSRLLPAVLAPGAFVLSELPLEISGARALPLPAGVREGKYFLYRSGQHADG
jgi:hypothetical protein